MSSFASVYDGIRSLTIIHLRFLLGALYWYTSCVALPKWRGYKLEDRTEVLKDGTSITTIAHVPI